MESIQLICCDLGDRLKCRQGPAHSSLLICFNEDVGGKTMENRGAYSQPQSLPKSYSHLNLKKTKEKKKPSCVDQATHFWPELAPWVQFDICYGAGSLWDILGLGGISSPSQVLDTCPQDSLVQALWPCAPGSCSFWLTCREGLCHQLTESLVWGGKLGVRVPSGYGLSSVGLWNLKKSMGFLVVPESGLSRFQLCC